VLETPPPPPMLADDAEDGNIDEERTNARAADEGSEQQSDGRNKVIAFLVASWAELQRVQWPNRQQTTTLTGIVLGFVIIMGAYLGALDAVFSRLIQLII
jgi:preprotein translocase subunit SecE